MSHWKNRYLRKEGGEYASVVDSMELVLVMSVVVVYLVAPAVLFAL